jgi:hypothetical protein
MLSAPAAGGVGHPTAEIARIAGRCVAENSPAWPVVAASALADTDFSTVAVSAALDRDLTCAPEAETREYSWPF